jgi:hypothetical protein
MSASPLLQVFLLCTRQVASCDDTEALAAFERPTKNDKAAWVHLDFADD